MQNNILTRHKLFIALSAASLSMASMAQVETTKPKVEMPTIEAPSLEEMLVTGRQQSGAMSILQERMEDAFSADLMGSDQISRTGDSNVAVALTRVTGVTLNQGKYVYVRGLGERYSSVQLNGAQVPSPELTRNVLPLDILPASIVDSLKIQKSYSPDLPANFGGGNVDIRTKTVPDEFVLNLNIGTGSNSNNSDDVLSYTGGENNKGLPSVIANALDTYQGKINVNGILSFEDTINGAYSAEQITQARQINRTLMQSINRDVEITDKKSPYDENVALALGNSWELGDNWTLGSILNWSQKTEWRNKNQIRKGIGSPEINYAEIKRSTEDTKDLASIGLGVEFQDNHEIQASYMQVGNDSDEAAITLAQNNNNLITDGRQKISYQTTYQDRQLDVAQLLGKHSFDQLAGSILGNIEVDWFYSDSSVETNLPGGSNIVGDNEIDPTTGALIRTSLSSGATNTFSYLNLKDDVRSHGWNAKLPLSFETTEVVLTGGYSYNDKAREYYGYTAWVTTGGGNFLEGTPGTVFNDANVADITNSLELTMSQGFGTESYVAAQMTDAFYGMIDATFNDAYRITAGARYEDFRTALLPIDLLDYSGVTIQKLITDLQKEDQKFASRNDGWYPSVAATYINDGFMGSETFQLRGSYSQTLTRPDLRELSDVTYIDPELTQRVQGNPTLVAATLDNFEIRGEWYFEGGDNVSASLFYKDITNPIEQKLIPGSDQDVLLGFYNADSGKIYGLELEGLYNLDYGLFLSGNLTLSDSEIVSPTGQGFTNPVRTMTGQSPYVLNMQLGYDSDDEKHSAALSYNIAGEKIYFSALETGHDDAFEQPFSSLDITYSYFPTEQLTLKAKLRNLLDENREITQTNTSGKNVTILSQEVGTSLSLDIGYNF